MQHIRSSRCFCGAALVMATITSATAWAADSYSFYRNARFGYGIEFPSSLLVPQRESDNGDGRTFLSRDKKIRLTVYASHNTSKRNLSAELARARNDWARDKAKVTYARTFRNYFVLSGYFRDNIFYEKTVSWNGAFHTMLWEYPRSQKARLDEAVNRSVRSFAPSNFRLPRISVAPKPVVPAKRVAITQVAPLPATVRTTSTSTTFKPRGY